MATSQHLSGSTKEHSNYARLCRLLIDGGTLVVKDVFDSIHPPTTLYNVLHDETVRGTLKLLRTRGVLNTHQWNKLYPRERSSVTSSSFDITLLVVLLRNICGLTQSATRWNRPPTTSDTSKEADLVRIKFCRNELSHITSTSISDAEFEKYWNDIEAPLSRLSGSRYQDDIKRLKTETMEPEDEKYYAKAIKEWEQLEQRIISKLEEVLNILKSNTIVADNESKSKDYTEKLKSSILKSQTDYQPGLKDDEQIRTDDIFTNVTIQRGQKQLQEHLAEGGIGRKRKIDEVYKREDEYNSFHGHSVLNKCSEIFTFPVESDARVSKDTHKTYPKSILLTGQAGIGKTLFCQKLVKDWANDRLFDEEENTTHPDFQFVFLLTFRQLNLLKKKRLDLRELLNRSSVLNEQSNLDDAVFEYVLQNPEKLLLIIDGYDEYSHCSEVTGDSELKYPNNPRSKMPIPSLVAKLLKGKILQDSVVMITSRPGKKVNNPRKRFDVQVEINGFSSSQVLQFVEKYFKKKDRMKKAALDHFQQHESMLEFVHVPVICLLMCYFLEWHLTYSESPINLPVTRTDLYYEVTKVFIRKHHVNLKYAKEEEADQVFEETYCKMAELAATLLDENKYMFDEDDLSNLKFCKQQIENLEGSGILYCYPGSKKSPLGEITQEYAFIHLTVQEYFAAYCFVENKTIPENGSDEVLQFMSGLLAKKRDKEFMTRLLNSINQEKIPEDGRRRLRLAKCLCEYRDTNLATEFIKGHFKEFCIDKPFSDVNDSNSAYELAFVLDVVTLLHQEQLQHSQPHGIHVKSFYVERFAMTTSFLPVMGVRRIMRSLADNSCTVTELVFANSGLKDDSVKTIADLLISAGKLVDLDLRCNDITDKGVSSICDGLTNKNCKLTTLDLRGNKITDKGVSSIFESLSNENCKLTTLDLSGNEITDKGVSSICESLTNENCKLTTLDLRDNKITNKRVSSICKSLTNENCRLTTLDLSGNGITNKVVSSICDSLTNENCKLTTLALSGNRITDKGVSSICVSLTNENCKLTTLDLSSNKFTDKGVSSICESLKNQNCKLTDLDLSDNEVIDKGVSSICKSLTNENCKLTTLDLSFNKITDKGSSSICESLTNENCRLITLYLSGNRIPDKGVSSLCELLTNENCQLTNLDLSDN